MLVNKNYINIARNVLKQIINSNQQQLEYAEVLKHESLKDTKITLLYQLIKKKYSEDIKKIETIRNALSKNGMTTTCYSLPRLILSANFTDLEYQYLIITGIYKNGTEIKTNSELMNEDEEKLVLMEQEMAKLINEDFSVNILNQAKFLNIYEEYLKTFMYFIMRDFNTFFQIPLEEKIDISVFNMQNYLTNILNSKPTKKITSKTPIIIPIKHNPLDEYIYEGKIIKTCSLEEFNKLLENLNLSILTKENYLAQMRNYLTRIEKEKQTEILNNLKTELLAKEDLELYELAKVSNNIEATLLIKDIEAAIEIYLIANPEEQEELKLEIINYLNILRTKINNEDNITLNKQNIRKRTKNF